MIDFHSHIIPYLDDGSKNYDMSIEMLNISAEEGVNYICATPHFIYQEEEIERSSYDEKLQSLRELTKLKNINVSILSGLEIYIHPELPRLYKEKKVWGINDTQYLLIELPMAHFPVYTEEVFYELRVQGAIPILAHPERNIEILKNKKLLRNLVKQGALAQITSGSLRGIYGKDIKNFSEVLIKENLVHVFGSDAHNTSKRNTNLVDEFKNIKSMNEELYNWISTEQYKIINGTEVEALSIKEKKKRGILNIFSGIH